jgi:RecA/RadA recombinase
MAKRISLRDKVKIDKAVKSVKDSSKKTKLKPLSNLVISWKKTISTGSTLLDLAISGGRVHGGGVPGGILVEVYGRSGSGKTSVLSELCGSAQAAGGDILFLDPEARLDEEYTKTYGVEIPENAYHQPDTVIEMFDYFDKWDPKATSKVKDPIHVVAADSLAALSTELELTKGDKMGMRRAKEFSQELRKHARKINKNNWVMACSNQVRQGDYGDITPGGKAVEFYASLRISVNQREKLFKERQYAWTDTDGKKRKGKAIKKAFGIKSWCIVTKSSIDKPYREVPIYIIFDYGIDDIRGNLQWMKDTLGLSTYRAVDKDYQRMDLAIKYIEENDLEDELREEVIKLWDEVEKNFSEKRKKKSR